MPLPMEPWTNHWPNWIDLLKSLWDFWWIPTCTSPLPRLVDLCSNWWWEKFGPDISSFKCACFIGCRHQSALLILLHILFSDPVCPIFFCSTCDKLPFEYYPREGFVKGLKFKGFSGGTSGEEPAYGLSAETMRDMWVGKIPWKRAWQSTPGFLPRKSHEQRSLTGYRPWGCKESDTIIAT